MIHGRAPKNRYGRALLYGCYILNRLPWKTGEDDSCIERYYQRKIANPRKHIRVFGCASWVHLVHPTGAHMDKLDSKAELHVLVGYDPTRRCYINETLAGKTVYSAHCTFNESMFPWGELSTYGGPSSSDFLDDDALTAIRFPHSRIAESMPEEQTQRPQRTMQPSRKVIANAAALMTTEVTRRALRGRQRHRRLCVTGTCV